MLVATNLVKRVISPEGSLTILDGISVTVGRGESVAVVGASGSGKSTLLALLAGLDTASSGRVSLDGVELTDQDEDGRAQLRAGRVGFVFQNFQLLASLTAIENVMLPLELGSSYSSGRTLERAAEALERVELTQRRRHYPSQLSGGEQQRVAIARAFVTDPVILFADEPTGNLDTATGKRVMDLLFDLNREKNTTLLLVTHDSDLAARCDRRLELVAGRLCDS